MSTTATEGIACARDGGSFLWRIFGIVFFKILLPNGCHELVQLYFLVVYNRSISTIP
jgi:hypothetical protein